MLSNDDWLRLITGLAAATGDGRIRWDEDNTRDQEGGLPALMMIDIIQRERVLKARNGQAYFELSSRSDGSPPYELQVTERIGGESRVIGGVRSTTSVSSAARYEINVALEALHAVVSEGIETGREVVDRLLGDLGV